jgi:hypothetical protein
MVAAISTNSLNTEELSGKKIMSSEIVPKDSVQCKVETWIRILQILCNFVLSVCVSVLIFVLHQAVRISLRQLAMLRKSLIESDLLSAYL